MKKLQVLVLVLLFVAIGVRAYRHFAKDEAAPAEEAPRTSVSVGDTRDQAIAIMGEPSSTFVDQDGLEIIFYGSDEIHVRDGVVVDVQLTGGRIGTIVGQDEQVIVDTSRKITSEPIAPE